MTIPINVNSKILLSGAAIAAAAALIIGATFAFFSDTETSVNNTIQAGSIDLKVDSISHYNEAICIANPLPATAPPFIWSGGEGWPIPGTACDGTWTETDLGATHKFFNLTDVKPGDDGEDTISLHVYDNDSWGRFVISGVQDLDNTCTEPESEVIPGSLDPECTASPAPTPGPGELASSISFYAWLDQGEVLGFQCFKPEDSNTGAECDADPLEGDNEQCTGEPTECDEPTLIAPGNVDLGGEIHNIWQGLAQYNSSLTDCNSVDPDGDGHVLNPDGTYAECHGLADDGRFVGSATYYFGLAWSVPEGVGNEAQTDSLNADLTFEVEQHRNNPTPFGP